MSGRSDTPARSRRHLLTALAVATSCTAFAAASVDAGAAQSAGRYRLPYVTAAAVSVGNDHRTHTPPGRIDMTRRYGAPVVAAASGTIRAVVDANTVRRCQDDATVVGRCSDYNNYVWIQHANGEWTKYTHLQTGSVTARGWKVGSRVTAGATIGLEGDVGAASGSHLHFEVAVPTDPNDLTPFSVKGGFIEGTNVIPRFCNAIGGTYNVTAGRTYFAVPC